MECHCKKVALTKADDLSNGYFTDEMEEFFTRGEVKEVIQLSLCQDKETGLTMEAGFVPVSHLDEKGQKRVFRAVKRAVIGEGYDMDGIVFWGSDDKGGDAVDYLAWGQG